MATLTSPPARHAFGGDGGPLFFAALGGLLGGKLVCLLVSSPSLSLSLTPTLTLTLTLALTQTLTQTQTLTLTQTPTLTPAPTLTNPSPAGLYQQSGGQLWLPLATHALWNLVVVLERAALLAQSA